MLTKQFCFIPRWRWSYSFNFRIKWEKTLIFQNNWRRKTSEIFLQVVVAEASCRVFWGGQENILLNILVSWNSFNIIKIFHFWIEANPKSLLLWPCRTNLRNPTAPSHLPCNIPISPAPPCSEEMPHLLQRQETGAQGSQVTCPRPQGKSAADEGPRSSWHCSPFTALYTFAKSATIPVQQHFLPTSDFFLCTHLNAYYK